MTKAQAQEAMRSGKKVTHRHFEPHEWATTEGNKVLTEDGVRALWDEWWSYRRAPGFNNDWEIWIESSVKQKPEAPREDIRFAFAEWIKNEAGVPSEYNRMYGHHLNSFKAGVLWSEATLSTREKNVKEAEQAIYKIREEYPTKPFLGFTTDKDVLNQQREYWGAVTAIGSTDINVHESQSLLHNANVEKGHYAEKLRESNQNVETLAGECGRLRAQSEERRQEIRKWHDQYRDAAQFFHEEKLKVESKDKELSELREQVESWKKTSFENHDQLDKAGVTINRLHLDMENKDEQVRVMRNALEKASSHLAFGKSLISWLPRESAKIVGPHPQADIYDLDCVELRKEISAILVSPPTGSEWISVKDRQPEFEQSILVWDSFTDKTVQKKYTGGFADCYTHWRAAFTPPTGKP